MDFFGVSISNSFNGVRLAKVFYAVQRNGYRTQFIHLPTQSHTIAATKFLFRFPNLAHSFLQLDSDPDKMWLISHLYVTQKVNYLFSKGLADLRRNLDPGRV